MSLDDDLPDPEKGETEPLPAQKQPEGRQIGPYKLIQKLGEGGMGTVWEAEQQQPVRRRVALKVIKPGMDTGQVVRRFEAERQALAMMDHPCIAKVLDAGATDGGRPYFVMELVKGVPITQYCDKLRLSLRERLELFVPVCQAIQHAHQKGIIHRDIKPNNVLVSMQDDRPTPKVIDFGLAKALHQKLTDRTIATSLGAVLGTLEYMSPEQAELSALDVDTRADVYSLGVLLYELLTGTTPLTRASLQGMALDKVLATVREFEPEKPSSRLSHSQQSAANIAALRRIEPGSLSKELRGELDWIVMHCLERDRRRRYDTATDLARDVENYLHDEPVVACPPSATYRLKKLARKHRKALVSFGVIFGLLIAGIAVSTWQAVRATRAEAVADQKTQDAEKATKDATLARDNATRSRDDALAAKEKLGMQVARNLIDHASDEFRDGRIDNGLALLGVVFSDEITQASNPLRDSACNLVGAWGQQVMIVLRHDDEVTSVAFSPDGRSILTGSGDKTARLWDAQTGKPLGEPLRHDDRVNSVAFSPDGRIALTGSDDTTARLWDVHTGQPLGEPLQHYGQVNSVAFSPDDRAVLTGCADHAARLWDARTGKPLGEPLLHEGRVLSVAFSPDGDIVLTGSVDNTARLWNSRTGALLGEPLRHEDDVTSVAFSPDGRAVLTGSADKTARLWDAQTGKPLGEPLRHDDRVNSVAFSPDGRAVLTGSFDGMARLWDAQTGLPLGEPFRHEGRVLSVAFSPDGRIVLTGTDDKKARLWDAQTNKPLGDPLRHYGQVNSVAFSPDGHTLLTGSDRRRAQQWDVQTGIPLGDPLQLDFCVKSVAFSPDGRIVLTGTDDKKARQWNAQTGKPLGESLQHDGQVNSVAFSPDGRTVLTGSWDKTARLWDARTGQPLGEPLRHEGVVTSVAFSPDGRTVLTGSWDKTARRWDAQTGKPLGDPLRHENVVTSVAFSPDGRTVLTGSWDKTARLSDAQTSKPLGDSLRHAGQVYSVAFSPDGRTILTGSSDLTARLWDAQTGKPLGGPLQHDSSVTAVAFSPDGRLAVTAAGNAVWMWSVPEPPPDHDQFIRDWTIARSGHVADVNGHIRAASAQEMDDAYQRWTISQTGQDWLRRRAENELRRADTWHRYTSANAEQKNEFFAAVFHLQWLTKSHPGDAGLMDRLEKARVKLAQETARIDPIDRAVRARWSYDQGQFEIAVDRVWIECFDDDQKPNQFHETERNLEYVELYDQSRDIGVRLYATEMTVKQPGHQEYAKFREGYWSD